jgi:hypothetical protein
VYSTQLKAAIAKAPRTLGGELGRRAIVLDFSVIRIAKATGATRQTVYNWLTGTADISPAYEDKVRTLFQIMGQASTGEEAWVKACQTFKLHT